jgi:hypothetical protein
MSGAIKAVVFVASLLLTGCASVAFEEAGSNLDEDLAGCNQLYPNKRQKPTLPRIDCVVSARTHYFASLPPYYAKKYADINRLTAGRMRVAAERFDKGISTEAEFEAEIASAQLQFNAVIDERTNSAAMLAGAQ